MQVLFKIYDNNNLEMGGMIKQFHDQVWVLAQFSKVRARFELF